MPEMNIRTDLFGNQVDLSRRHRVFVFHDDRLLKSDRLYHGYLFAMRILSIGYMPNSSKFGAMRSVRETKGFTSKTSIHAVQAAREQKLLLDG